MTIMKLEMTRFRRQLFIKSGIILGIFCVITAFVVTPKQGTRNTLMREVQWLESESTRIGHMVHISQNFGERLHDILNTLRHYKSMILPEDSLSGVLEDIASRAQVRRIDVISLKPLDAKPLDMSQEGAAEMKRRGVRETVIELKAKGTYLNVGRYMDDLERTPYAIIVKDVKLRNKINVNIFDRSAEPILDVELKLGVLMKSSDTTQS